MRGGLFLFAFILVGMAMSCSRGVDSPPAPANVESLSAHPTVSTPTSTTLLDLIAGFDNCTLSHRGVLLDLGDPTMRARMSSGKLKAPEVEMREHEGASWASLNGRALELSFVSQVQSTADTGVIVEARIRGGIAKGLSVYLNGKSLGLLPLKKGETNVVSVRAASASLEHGANDLLLRAVGGARTTHDNLAEIDWIRVGADGADTPYAAPTRSDVLTTVTIGGVARRGFSLRAPGSVRCGGAVPNGAFLEGQVGVIGGEAEAEVRVLVDRAEPRVVGQFKLGGEGTPAWQPVSLPLGNVGTLASVELVAKSSSKGARVVFAEPRVTRVATPSASKPNPSRGVIVVVLGTVSAKSLSPYGGKIVTTELAQLAEAGTLFDSHRAATGVANGAIASILTGVSAREHGVLDADAALASNSLTIAEAARQAGVATAMFTANPTTFGTFGFERGWETFVARSPATDASATSLFDDVEKWLDQHKESRFLIVVHARGGHPPWDVTSDEIKELAPPGYSGSLDPKHAGEMLSKVRKSGVARLFTDADRERAFALHARALAAHDAALGKLLTHVRAIGRDDSTTWIVTGDVGVDAAASAPFLDDEGLDEGALAIPLIVRGPTRPARGRVLAPTTSVDLARTTLEALGLQPPPQFRGESLWPLTERASDDAERPRFAMTGARFSARWSGFVLAGTLSREGKLCNLSLEPSCVSDVRATHPLAAELMHALVFDEFVTPKKPTTARVRTSFDAETTAALRAWGVIAGKPAGK